MVLHTRLRCAPRNQSGLLSAALAANTLSLDQTSSPEAQPRGGRAGPARVTGVAVPPKAGWRSLGMLPPVAMAESC